MPMPFNEEWKTNCIENGEYPQQNYKRGPLPTQYTNKPKWVKQIK